ncbi:putative RNA-binding protein [Trypanosoma grayi]|uniref:putative RNA-binding protein n=1 Tax=Trypanosoma grayi TaxID=71804 RepID=UPI0004F4B781|nr:putative RNA-binding protein [Trypanosoma grayi]KEG10123.1 putative RNA-binding protein [Trypanosoma grayi]
MPPYTIQVRGLPEETSENAVRDFFSRVGEVTECALNGTAATLSFDNADDFNEALNMDGIEFEKGATIQVDKKEAEKTEEEQQKHEQNEASGDNCNNNANGAKTAEGDDAAPAESRKRFREEFKIAVRHLAENTTEQQLRDLFEPLGAISDLFLEPGEYDGAAAARSLRATWCHQ